MAQTLLRIPDDKVFFDKCRFTEDTTHFCLGSYLSTVERSMGFILHLRADDKPHPFTSIRDENGQEKRFWLRPHTLKPRNFRLSTANMIRRIRREGSFERAITKALLEMLIKGIKVNVFYIPEGFIHFDDPERFRIDIYFADAPVGSWVSDPANFEHFTLL